MKRKTKILLAVLSAALVVFAVFCVQTSKIIGEEGLIAMARQEIKNLADIETIEIKIAGKSSIGSESHLFWFITGNEHQMHRYVPMEFTELGDNEYEFVRKYSAFERGQDIFAVLWHHSYSFVVNNPDCKSISVWGQRGETKVAVDEIPFVYHYPGLPGEYKFFDKEGNEIR